MTIRCIEAGSMTGFLIAAVDDGPMLPSASSSAAPAATPKRP